MIVTESDRDSKSLQPTEESTSLVDAASSSGLPTYYQRDPATPPPPTSPSTDPLMNHKSTRREPAWKRFSKALLVAVAIYILLGILIKSFVILAERHFVQVSIVILSMFSKKLIVLRRDIGQTIWSPQRRWSCTKLRKPYMECRAGSVPTV